MPAPNWAVFNAAQLMNLLRNGAIERCGVDLMQMASGLKTMVVRMHPYIAGLQQVGAAALCRHSWQRLSTVPSPSCLPRS